MEKIGSNPYLNVYSNPYQRAAAQAPQSQIEPSPTSTPRPLAAESLRDSPQPAGKVQSYSNMFEDDALLKLQSNLQAVSDFAEKALKRIDA